MKNSDYMQFSFTRNYVLLHVLKKEKIIKIKKKNFQM
jgi:hypothetical protein